MSASWSVDYLVHDGALATFGSFGFAHSSISICSIRFLDFQLARTLHQRMFAAPSYQPTRFFYFTSCRTSFTSHSTLRTDIIFFAIFRVACNMHQRFTLHAVRVLFCCLRTSFSRLSELSDRMIGERSQHAPTQTYCRSSSWFISDGPGFGPASAFHGT